MLKQGSKQRGSLVEFVNVYIDSEIFIVPKNKENEVIRAYNTKQRRSFEYYANQPDYEDQAWLDSLEDYKIRLQDWELAYERALEDHECNKRELARCGSSGFTFIDRLLRRKPPEPQLVGSLKKYAVLSREDFKGLYRKKFPCPNPHRREPPRKIALMGAKLIDFSTVDKMTIKYNI